MNEAADDLWKQIFDRAAAQPYATLDDPEYDHERSNAMLAQALRDAGWPEDHVIARVAATDSFYTTDDPTSPGVGPGLEKHLRRIAQHVGLALSEMGYSSHEKIVLGVDPKAGVSAALTNVIMTDQGIVSVSSFLFRWCGLIARAYVRSLLLHVQHWSESSPNSDEDKRILLNHPTLVRYWFRIFASFTTTGTHILVPFRPSTPSEILIFEQVAWAMEFFTVGHEFAHHALTHRATLADQKAQELEADALAVKVCERLEFEPIGLSNPYARTGAGATLMLHALAILRVFDQHVNGGEPDHDTHPPINERIAYIEKRHIIHPRMFKMDRDFNGTVTRIMNAVAALMAEFLTQDVTTLLADMTERADH